MCVCAYVRLDVDVLDVLDVWRCGDKIPVFVSLYPLCSLLSALCSLSGALRLSYSLLRIFRCSAFSDAGMTLSSLSLSASSPVEAVELAEKEVDVTLFHKKLVFFAHPHLFGLLAATPATSCHTGDYSKEQEFEGHVAHLELFETVEEQ
jgi:hypothetical protein